MECTERGRFQEIVVGIASRATTACRAYAGLRISLTRLHQFFLQEQHDKDGKARRVVVLLLIAMVTYREGLFNLFLFIQLSCPNCSTPQTLQTI